MPGAEATTLDDVEELAARVDSNGVASITDSELKNEWKKLVTEIESTTYETDVEALHTDRNVRKAIELAFSHPDSVAVSTKPVSRRHDMSAHVREHFDSLLNEPERGHRLKRGRPDTERLLKACELAYLYDAVFRFSSETIVDTDIDGLERLRFVKVPEEVHVWMGEVDVLWRVLHDELAAEEPVAETIDELHAERDTFVEAAKEAEIFLPIRSDYVPDVDAKRDTIEKRLRRNAHVPPKQVHDYCFSRAVDIY